MSVTEFICSLFIPPKTYRTFGMRVTIMDHGCEVNSLGAQKIVIVSPVDTLLQREYGKEITIKSDAVFDYFKNGQEAYLPFMENPEYDSELLKSEKVVIRNDLLGNLVNLRPGFRAIFISSKRPPSGGLFLVHYFELRFSIISAAMFGGTSS